MGKIDGRTTDKEFSWLTKRHGSQWETWRQYALEWTRSIQDNLGTKIQSISIFFDRYLCPHVHYAVEPLSFFCGYEGHRCSTEELKEMICSVNNPPRETVVSIYTSNISAFLDWVVEKHFSEPDDHGRYRPLFSNPIQKIKRKGIRLSETCYSSLPYRYITELRSILCPVPLGNFSDWKWAQKQTGQGTGPAILLGDWFEVDPLLIDQEDPDCVWRKRDIYRQIKGRGQCKVTIYQIWSPVRSVALLVKLLLPLRTTQVRLLDSGEADTFRYSNGEWIENNVHSFVMGSNSWPREKGVFRKIFDDGELFTGIYVNSNKTADRNREEIDHGYVIPWPYKDVIYWFEKLRNWQEKYNPITALTDCTTLLPRHTAGIKSQDQLRGMGSICFLFRDPTDIGGDNKKPIFRNSLNRIWYRLLREFETLLNADLEPGRVPVRLVKEYDDKVRDCIKTTTEFPLHSLRVSLITAYLTEGSLPLDVVSKLLAGHARLVMTCHYQKMSEDVYQTVIRNARSRLRENGVGLARSLTYGDAGKLPKTVIGNDDDSASVLATKGNPVCWEFLHIGICLAGGNTGPVHGSSVVGCWNGGPEVNGGDYGKKSRSPVPHGLRNCVRCRWFVTDASYFHPLSAHFNSLNYRCCLAADEADKIRNEKDLLEKERFRAEEQGGFFHKKDELARLQRRLEIQEQEVTEYIADMCATRRLVKRIKAVENDREGGDDRDRLVGAGDRESIEEAMRLLEPVSETHHLSILLGDAVVFPELMDALARTPAIGRLSNRMNHALMKGGFPPALLEMGYEEQAYAVNTLLRRMARMSDPDDLVTGLAKAAARLDSGDIGLTREAIEEIFGTLSKLRPGPAGLLETA